MLHTRIKPMLLKPSASVVKEKGFLSSLKYDGFRILIHYDNGHVRAFSREGTEVTASFKPELDMIRLPVRNAILDGECICFDSSLTEPYAFTWDHAMSRFHTRKPYAVSAAAKALPAHFPVWDVLMVNDESLLMHPFLRRREVLNDIVKPNEVISVAPLFYDAQQLFDNAKALKLEGICSYNTNVGPKSYYYLDSRPDDVWIKTKAYQYVTCKISSIRKDTFGWGLMVNGRYVGVLEFPPSAAERKAFYSISKQIVREENKKWIQLDPVISCTIKYQSFTKNGMLRSPVFERFEIG